jgi:anti-sigma regulatory factor (Ser/Thr protein kinase)
MSSSDGVLRDEPTDATFEPSLDQPFDIDGLVALRSAVAAHADLLGLRPAKVQELVLVAHELASNAVRHGGGTGRLRLWRADNTVYCEVRDDGNGLDEERAERFWRPAVDALSGRGLWLAYHLCDQFEVISSTTGTVATATMRVH